MITVERISTVEHFRALESAWTRLLQDGGYHSIFQTHPWLFTWWDCLCDGNELYVLVVKDQADIRAIAPLMLTVPAREIRFIGTPNADYSDIIAQDKEQAWKEVLNYLNEHRADWNTVILDQLTDRATSHEALRTALKSSSLLSRESLCDTCMAFQYEGDSASRQTFELRKNTNVRKAVRHFEQLGGYKLERLNEAEALRQLPSFFHLHITRWSQTATPSKFTMAKHRQFYIELIKRLGPLRQVYFTVMMAGGVPVSYCMKFAYNGTINHYTLAYNPYFSKWSPGVAFVVAQSEKLVREGFFLDFSRGAQDYKQVMTNRTFKNYRFDIFQSEIQARTYDMHDQVRRLGFIRKILDNRGVAQLRARMARMSGNGVTGLIGGMARRALRLLYDHLVIRVFSHQGAPADVPAPEIPVEIRELQVDQLPVIATFYGAPQTGQKYQTLVRRFEQRADCFGVFHDGNLVTISWGLPFTDIDPVTGFALAPGENDIVLSDGLTSLPYRGMGLRSYLLQYQLSKYCRENKRVLLATANYNSSMLRVISRFNFAPEPSVHIIRVLGLRVK